MTTADNELTQNELDERLLKHMFDGGTLGTLAGMTGQELEAVYAVGYNHFTARKYGKAIELFRFLCLYDHTEPRWFHSLGVAQQAAGDYRGALDSYAMATLLDIENPAPQAQAGYCLTALGEKGAAKNALEGAVIACGKRPEHARTKQQAQALLKTLGADAAKEE